MEKNNSSAAKWLVAKQPRNCFMSLFNQLLVFMSLLLIVTLVLTMLVSLGFHSINQISVLLVTSVGIFLVGLSITYSFLKKRLMPLSELNIIIHRINRIYSKKGIERTAMNENEEMIANLNQLVEYLEMDVVDRIKRIGQGDLNIDFKNQYTQSKISDELLQITDSIEGLYFEIDMIVKACQEGKLDIRGNVDLFNGKYRDIISGVNTMLDAITGPVSTVSEYVYRIGNGERPELITDTYKGEFDVLKNNVNSCIQGLAGLEECNRILSLMSKNDFTQNVEGDFLGIYSDLARSINLVNIKLVRVVEISTNIGNGNMCDLEALRKVPRQSENDQIIPCLIRMIENIIQLVEETEKMAEIAVEGDLSNRVCLVKY